MAKNKYFKKIKLEEFNRSIQWRRKIASGQKNIADKSLTKLEDPISCPICTDNNSKSFVTVYRHSYHECINCGHIYLKKPPKNQFISELYETEDIEEPVKSLQGEIYIQESLYKKRVNEIAKPKAEFADKLIIEKGKWVDIGAGVGDLVLALKELGWDVIGYESDKNEVDFATSMGSNVIKKVISKKDFKLILKDVKVVSAINILEHLKDPKSFVNEISKNLNKESFLLFEVPRFPSISSLANKCFPDLTARNIVPPDHLHIFTDKSMKIMIRSAGLEIISTWFFGQDIYELFGNILTKGNFENHSLIDKVISLTNDLQKVVDKNGLSDTMLVLAKK